VCLQAIFVPAGTSAALAAALSSSSGSPAAAAYGPASAVQWVWDEGRNPSITTARVGAPLRVILSKFAAEYAAQQLVGLAASGANITALAAAQPALISGPVGSTETNLYPAAAALPVGSLAQTIGLIIITVFAMAGVNAFLGVPLPALSPVTRAVVGSVAVFVFGMTIAAAYATIVAGMGALSGPQWAQLWATMWLLYLVRAPAAGGGGMQWIGKERWTIAVEERRRLCHS
jgi:hypothetical protein